MPWKTPTAMSLRRELVLMAAQPGANVADLSRRYGVSRQTAYKWIARYREGGPDALADRSRRPAHSPSRTPPEIEAAVLRVRDAHASWGGRKIRRVLLNEGVRAPSPATIAAILRRHGHLSPQPEPRDYVRFEAEAPNELWQMDFKGDFLLGGWQPVLPARRTRRPQPLFALPRQPVRPAPRICPGIPHRPLPAIWPASPSPLRQRPAVGQWLAMHGCRGS